MKNGWTTHSSNNAIWLALSPCHMTMTCKINKLEKPGGQLKNFHTLFGRSAAFYGHFGADTVMSEWSTRISSSKPGVLLFLSFFETRFTTNNCILQQTGLNLNIHLEFIKAFNFIQNIIKSNKVNIFLCWFHMFQNGFFHIYYLISIE